MKWNRQQYVELMTFAQAPRPMFCELFGPLVGLEAEWRDQGASEEEIALTAFDWDYVPAQRLPVNLGLLEPAPQRIIEETDAHLIKTDGLGRTMKLCKASATIPLPLDYPVKTMDDWQAIKWQFQWREDRLDLDAVAAAAAEQQNGAMLVAGIPGGYDLPRQLLGEENSCLAYYEQPELVADILDTARQCCLQAYRRVIDAGVVPDQLSVHEDLAGKSGPMLGPRQIEQFVRPYFSEVWALLGEAGTKIFGMDSDGNVNAVIPAFLDCGLTAMHPMEPAAGMDIVELRKTYGRKLAMKGGIDKHVLRASKDDIRKELEYKLQPLMQEGGMVFGLDHRIPNGTPLEHYRYYVDLGREILGLPPRDSAPGGWARMAF